MRYGKRLTRPDVKTARFLFGFHPEVAKNTEFCMFWLSLITSINPSRAVRPMPMALSRHRLARQQTLKPVPTPQGNGANQ